MAMRQRKYPGIDVTGVSALAFFAAMGSYRAIAEKALARHSIWKIDADLAYPLDTYLGVFNTIIETAGVNTAFAIGKRVPEYAAMPPGIENIFQVLESIDIGYHLNHLKDGKTMFDPSTGEILEGIGHYHYKVEGPRRIVMTCENPYPSDFDRGIITAFARKYEDAADVERDTTKPTRLDGAESCTFIVTF